MEMAHARFAPGIIFRRIGGTTSSRSIRVTGSAIGIAAAITFGTDIIVGSSTDPGSSSTSDSIHGGRIGTTRTTITPTITTAIRTVTTRAITIQALTKTKSITARTATAIMPTPPLLLRSSSSHGKVIIADKSTVLSVRKHGERS